MPRPQSILMVSAHWEERPATLGATRTVPLVYDFYGFPEKYYQTKYPAPGAPALAARVRDLLRARGIACADDPERGLDHGAYVPLVAMYPDADVPVLQMSLPRLDPAELFALGRALAPLRDEGVLVFGSGFLTHNMAYAFRPGIPAWAREFDAWAADALSRLDMDALMDFATAPRRTDGAADLGALRAGPGRGGSRGRRAAPGELPDHGLLDGGGLHEAVGAVRLRPPAAPAVRVTRAARAPRSRGCT